ncbi:MAG: class I SAM-dependent methyltransferase [Syntrophorhabdus sp.]|nr:class I SAM-dependent methyltransferase [Syntrophorhabdus sp.]
MNRLYGEYAASRLGGQFGEMSSWRLVYPYLRDKRVLDIGCSDGLYLRYLSKDSRGIEQVPALAEVGRRNGLNIINEDLTQSIRQLKNEAFEGVLLSHVLEHIDSPLLMLREIHRLLESKGTLVVGLPTERNVYRDLLRMNYFNGTHLYAFSVRNAHRLLAEAGFVPIRVFFHLPKCGNPIGRILENCWNLNRWPFHEYFSMAYWIVATKL